MIAARGAGPELTVVLVCPGGRKALHRTLAAVAAQTIADRIEVLIVTPDDDLEQQERLLLDRFHSARVVQQQPIANVDHVVARWLVQGTAPIVASVEDHAYPEPDWAERLLATYDDTCVAVGTAVENANPGFMLSWSNMLVAYGQWSASTPEGAIGWLPLHNCSYRKSALVPFGETLSDLFNREGEVLVRLRDEGGSFRYAPTARLRHLNPSSWRSTARLRFDAGRLTAANRWRAEKWGMGKRLVFGLLGPLIPLVRYRRMRGDLFGKSPDVTERKHGLALLVGLVFDGAGQIAGFLMGPGGARDRLSVFEMDRMSHLNAADSADFQPVLPHPRT